MIQNVWKERLLPLNQREQFIKDALASRGILEDAYHPELEKIHKENSLKLQQLITQEGFPVLSNAGDEGVYHSWLIIQNAVPLPDFMRECLVQIRMAAAQDDYPVSFLARLEDRVCFLEGRPQIYGTNFDWFDGELKPTAIADPGLLDQRRKAMDLPPMGEALFKFSHALPPKNPQERIRKFEQRLKELGWR
jgi:hypothetical protein